jgi:hypothetical protein
VDIFYILISKSRLQKWCNYKLRNTNQKSVIILGINLPAFLLLLLLLLLWLYSPLLDLRRFSVSWSYTQAVGLLRLGISQSQGLYLHWTTQTQNKSTQYRHPCLEWDSNPWSQRSSERRQLMPSPKSLRKTLLLEFMPLMPRREWILIFRILRFIWECEETFVLYAFHRNLSSENE